MFLVEGNFTLLCSTPLPRVPLRHLSLTFDSSQTTENLPQTSSIRQDQGNRETPTSALRRIPRFLGGCSRISCVTPGALRTWAFRLFGHNRWAVFSCVNYQ